MSAARRRPRAPWLPPPHPDPASLPVDAVDAYVDGSGFRREGPAGIGVVLLWRDVVLYECGEPIGAGTCVVAEVRAVRRALHVAAGMFPSAPLTVHSDSRWAIDATTPSCDWCVRRGPLARLVEAVRRQRAGHPAPTTFALCPGRRALSSAAGDPAEELAIRAHRRADELAREGRLRCTEAAPRGAGDARSDEGKEGCDG